MPCLFIKKKLEKRVGWTKLVQRSAQWLGQVTPGFSRIIAYPIM